MPDPIRHVVVLMLENRSFDHMLGGLDSVVGEIDGCKKADIFFRDKDHWNINPGGGSPIGVNSNALSSLEKTNLDIDFDPHHEFDDVNKQLGLADGKWRLNGFTQDAWDSYKDELSAMSPEKSRAVLEQVMAYFPALPPQVNSPVQALHSLAKDSLVCNRWFSSVPGPTWPNRFFAVAGTSKGYLKMPAGISEIGPLFRSYDMPTIFNRLHDAGKRSHVYSHDVSLTLLLRKTWSIPGLRRSFDDFLEDADTSNPDDFPDFAFIEPRYFWKAFGSSPNDQHPPHDVANGDRLIAQVYNALRQNQALWNQTLLVVTYDEHGGFFDHVVPPETVAPDDKTGDHADFKFKFDRLGLRVPTLLCSPWIGAGVNGTEFDHTSLLAYLCRKWNLDPLGERCNRANDISGLFLGAPRATSDSLSAAPNVKKRNLRTDIALNGNQRALSAMVDYLGDYLGVGNQSPGLRALDTQSGDSVDRILRKVSEIESAISAANPGEIPRPASERIPVGGRDLQQPLKVLMVHGIGHGDDPAKSAWKEAWQDSFKSSAQIAGYKSPNGIEFDFAEFDEIFDQYPLDATTILHGLRVLGRDAFGEPPTFGGTRDLAQRGIPSVLRWTAGMVIQWIDNPELRAQLDERIQLTLASKPGGYDVICAHSLGGLICYDSFRRQIVKQGGKQFAGTKLLTFGCQLANPAVQSVFGGRLEPLVDKEGFGFDQWVHIFNTKDKVFTRPLPGGDSRTHSFTTTFDIPGDILNHDGAWYLKDQATSDLAMPLLLPALSAGTRSLTLPFAIGTARRSQRRALLVGINDYPDPAMQLNGCVNDVFLMSSVLQECGFDAGDIRVVTDRRATRAAILERLEWLSEGVGEGDERVFFYSGHGAQMDVYSKSGEPDRRDETLVPVDFDWSPEHAFTDKEFYQYYSHLPYGANFLAMFDCCHAGGMTRGNHRVRGISPPDDIRHRELRWSPERQMWVPRDFVEAGSHAGRAFSHQGTSPDKQPGATRDALAWRGLGEAKELWTPHHRTYDRALKDYGNHGPYVPLLLFAAAEDELASEYDHGSTAYGAFTYVLAKQLRAARKVLAFKELMSGVRKELNELGYNQTPQLSGPKEKCNANVPIGRWRARK